MFNKSLLILFLWLAVAAAQAGESSNRFYDLIKLSASAGQDVENDTLVVVMYAQLEGNDAADLARNVNKMVATAVDKAAASPSIKVQTLDYNTQPVYRKQTLSAWRVRQSIRLESREPALLSQLIGELQAQLGVSSISYVVSPELRRQVEDQLIKQAISAFNQRAELVSRAMQRSGFRLVEMQIDGSGHRPEPVQLRAMAMEAQASAPALEPGSRRVEVQIRGSIELKP